MWPWDAPGGVCGASLATYRIVKVHLEYIRYLFVSVSSGLNYCSGGRFGHLYLSDMRLGAFDSGANWRTRSSKSSKTVTHPVDANLKILDILLARLTVWLNMKVRFQLCDLWINGNQDHKFVFCLRWMKRARERERGKSSKAHPHLFPLPSSFIRPVNCFSLRQHIVKKKKKNSFICVLCQIRLEKTQSSAHKNRSDNNCETPNLLRSRRLPLNTRFYIHLPHICIATVPSCIVCIIGEESEAHN